MCFTKISPNEISKKIYKIHTLIQSSLWKKFQKVLIHKSCEKSESLKKQPKNTTFSHFFTFLEIYELIVFNIPYIKWPSPVLWIQKFLGKSIRQISRSRCVLLSHNGKRIFANPSVISCRPPVQNFVNFKCVPACSRGHVLKFSGNFLHFSSRKNFFPENMALKNP